MVFGMTIGLGTTANKRSTNMLPGLSFWCFFLHFDQLSMQCAHLNPPGLISYL